MEIDFYNTIEVLSLGEYKEKGSKFISYSFPIADINDFEKQIELIKKEHFKARHFCYAYRLGVNGLEFRANDDGEPNGSAGLPILNQLKSANLTHIASVVVRYFGGTKLGVSGLIRAYKEATKISISLAKIKEVILGKDFKILFDYSRMGHLMNTLKKQELFILEKSFEASPFVTIRIRNSEIEKKLISLQAALLHLSEEEFILKEPKLIDYQFLELNEC